MRLYALAASLVLIASPVAAQPGGAHVAEVSVDIGPRLEAKAHDYGQRDLDGLAADLRRTVERELVRHGRAGREGVSLHLVITDAKPNRPTFEQLGARPGLSMRSIGIGGASISGEEIGPNGRRPVSYSFWETDIRNERGAATWSDAERAFDLFARQYATGRR